MCGFSFTQACAANATWYVDEYGRGFAALSSSTIYNGSDDATANPGDKNSTKTVTMRLALPANGEVSLRLLVDGSSLELFANGGHAAATAQVGGSLNLARAAAGGVRVMLNASGGAAPVQASAAAWHMKCGDMKRC
eukprot:COSAG06_NODE_5382_length_3512_cov_6.128040_3_plen_136_part_00